MSNQKSNAGNEGDVMKHPPLHKMVEHHSDSKDEFWYVETHTGYPYYFLMDDPPMTGNPPRPKPGKWAAGIWDLDQNRANAPNLLTDFANVAHHDKQNVHVRFPNKRTYLGSAAQVFHLLKEKNKRVRMTLIELETDPAQELLEYFQGQGAKTLLVKTGSDAGHVTGFLRQWWDAAVANTEDDFVMVVQGDSYTLAPALWANGVEGTPDLVFVDPFKIGDSNGQPAQILASLNGAGVPFMCWTPLSCVPNQWQRAQWSFEDNGNQSAQGFVRDCVQARYHLAWFSWGGAAGSTREMYGCQLTFGNIFGAQFTPASIWQFAKGNALPYLGLTNQVTNQGRAPNFQNPSTTWQTPGPALIENASAIQAQAQPGVWWWDKYHAAFWWS